MRYLIILVVLIAFVSGCNRQSSQLIRHSYATNYKIGETKTAYIGQSILKVKDYYVYEGSESTFLEPTEDFALTADAPAMFSDYKLSISGLKGKRYETYSRLNIDGILYDIIYPTDSNGHNSYGILIDDRGTIKNNSLYYKNKIRTPTNFILQPSNMKFNKAVINYENFLCDVSNHYANNTCGFINYELIYSGINNVSMNITYREYSRDDYARPAFYQNLTYEPSTNEIRFKNFIIEILEANNSKFVYKILSDGLKETQFYEGEDPDFNRIKYSR
jgi:hypothetical protein